MDEASVASSLAAAGESFGPPPSDLPRLRWGSVFAALDGRDDREFVTAVELIYEGYLFHYRESRVCGPAAECVENALLAGDHLYAHGLRKIAARRDAASVGLLTRLMASCSCLRCAGAPFVDDDALWAYTMAGLAALRRGVSQGAVSAVFDLFDDALAEGRTPDVVDLANAGAGRLGLPDVTSLDAELAGAAARSLPAACGG